MSVSILWPYPIPLLWGPNLSYVSLWYETMRSFTCEIDTNFRCCFEFIIIYECIPCATINSTCSRVTCDWIRSGYKVGDFLCYFIQMNATWNCDIFPIVWINKFQSWFLRIETWMSIQRKNCINKRPENKVCVPSGDCNRDKQKHKFSALFVVIWNASTAKLQTENTAENWWTDFICN